LFCSRELCCGLLNFVNNKFHVSEAAKQPIKDVDFFSLLGKILRYLYLF
jgi:hypothetical protein